MGAPEWKIYVDIYENISLKYNTFSQNQANTEQALVMRTIAIIFQVMMNLTNVLVGKRFKGARPSPEVYQHLSINSRKSDACSSMKQTSTIEVHEKNVKCVKSKVDQTKLISVNF